MVEPRCAPLRALGLHGAVCLAVCHAAAAIAATGDAVALVQVSAMQFSASAGVSRVSNAVVETQDGPMAYTESGAILGAHEAGYDIFRGIPYVEPPARFEKAMPKRAWNPQVMDATRFGPGCIGSKTGVLESEDCLHLNIWLPKGGLKKMPVIVYFHGGMNQHGSGQEPIRHGDGVVQSAKFPTIFVNFDFRMGIFGWIYGAKGENITNNLGLYDQQEALRWVHRNIEAFGGDRSRVTLQGQSEGAGNIMMHLVSPGSAGLFYRVIFHSPPADIWSRQVNKERTEFMVNRLGCKKKKAEDVLNCLKKLPAQRVWGADWIAEELSRNIGSASWLQNAMGMAFFAFTRPGQEMPGFLGWHAVVDGANVPGEPRELIAMGRWHKVPVLLTVSKNETWGVFPGGEGAKSSMRQALGQLLRRGDLPSVERAYRLSLQKHHALPQSQLELLHQMLTDKLWTCEVRSLAKDIVHGGGEAFVGMFWHSPRYDPIGTATNQVCAYGATCHAAEMLYALPQGRNIGIHGPGMEQEARFAVDYRDNVLAFVHGSDHPWKHYDAGTQPMTFFDTDGHWVMEGYRKPQCDVLDASRSVSVHTTSQLLELHAKRAR
mmetsp:Transcript_53396/g.165247  ORF Transcript_53396/g.165247 Transcript_53396/m.165247 type:complete len:602 (+) Transcript_53396:97-1902(+)